MCVVMRGDVCVCSHEGRCVCVVMGEVCVYVVMGGDVCVCSHKIEW